MTVTAFKGANLALAFFMEVATLVAFGYWGFVVGQSLPAKIGLGIGVPLLAMVIWSLWGAPRSKWRLKGLWLLALRLIVFGSGTIALFLAGSPVWGIVFGLIFAINIILISIWGQE